MKTKKLGFTLVELLVVIAVISVLASISIIAFSQFSTSANDSARKSQVTSISKALDKYYQANGSYPNCNALTGDPDTIISTLGLTGLKPSVFKAPGDTASNSIQCGGSSAINKFVYTGDGTTECTNNTSSCRSFTLQYKEEGSGATSSVSGQYTAPVSSTAIVTLNQPSQGAGCTSTDFTALSISWSTSGPTSGITGFQAQASTNSSFTSGLIDNIVANPASTSYQFTNLTPGTTYYFRVRAVTTSNAPYSFWSSTKSQSPRNDALTLALNSAAATSTSLSVSSWSTNSCAAEYVLIRSTSSSMTSPTNTTYSTATTFPVTVSGLASSTTYYFKIRFNTVAGGATGYNSRSMPIAVISGTTSVAAAISAPATCTFSFNTSPKTGTANWGSVAGATAYTVNVINTNVGLYEGPANVNSPTVTYTTGYLYGSPNPSYYYTVSATNGTSTSANCTSNTITSSGLVWP